MKKVNPWYFYTLGSVVRPLAQMASNITWDDARFLAVVGRMSLDRLPSDEFAPVPLKYCLQQARRLNDALEPLLSSKEPFDITLTEVWPIRKAAEAFEATISAELSELNFFYVPPVGIFSASALLTKAEEMFGENRNLLPDITVSQIREAGKCLAFSLGSAAAFHLFAALESVLRVYYNKLSGGATAPKIPAWVDTWESCQN